MNDIPHASPFDALRHEDEQFGENWSARELYKVLGYTAWRNFNNVVIKRAMKACEENGRAVADHFVQSYRAITRERNNRNSHRCLTIQRTTGDHEGQPPHVRTPLAPTILRGGRTLRART